MSGFKQVFYYFLIFVGIFGIFSLLSCSDKSSEQTKNPNIIYILADDMGYGDVSALNDSSAWRTPNMDKLAKEGMTFTDAHSGSAVCTPTRYGVLTGRYAWRSRLKSGVLWSWDTPLIEKNRMTVASLLKQYGYKTACIGKWHLGLGWQYSDEDPDSVDFSKPVLDGPVTNGFDYFYGITASLDIPPYVYIENDQVTSLDVKYTESKDKYGWWRKGLTGSDFSHEQVLPHLTQKAVSFIHEHAGDESPFFLYYAMPAPHTPILPTKEFQGKSGTNPYGDFVLEVDYMIGQVMKAVEKNKLSENTLIIVTSDNGCSPAADFKELAKFNHDPSYVFRGEKADIFEGGHRIPFIVRWPGKVKSGTSSDQTICLTDLLETCAAIVGDKLPSNAGEDSYNLLPLFLNSDYGKTIREATVHHSINGSFSLRKGKWKLEMCSGSGGWSYPTPKQVKNMDLPPIQLYDLENDISEEHNVYDKYPEVVKEMEDMLKKYISDGRSTPGESQKYVQTENWPGIAWMKDENN